ncbi:MAG TPA: VOC family protein [Candidatus Kapabacteria bacterium]|nr:VOC family protein [Candidatus Kapabacteria bacterium]
MADSFRMTLLVISILKIKMKAAIGHIVISVSDFSRSEKFYDAIMPLMGFETHENESDSWVSMKLYAQGAHNLWIRWDKRREHQPFVRDAGLDHLAFMVESESQVNELYVLVQSLGVDITRTPEKFPEYSPTYYAFYFRDPDGVPLEVYLK